MGRTPYLPRRALALAMLLAGGGPALAQSGVTTLPKAGAVPSLADLPELPKVIALSPRSTMLFADRDEVAPAPGDYPPGTAPSAAFAPALQDGWISAKDTGTGMPESFQYQLPPDYTPKGPQRPLLVAWHGFGSSAKSVAQQTTLDEECRSWGWIYASVTGIDDKLFGSPACQQNAEAAILWLMDHYRVDRDRVYMVGFSMGAGIVANFAARHRDPQGLMIAGVGLVSGSYDWTATYLLDKDVQAWMANAWNFGGPPEKVPFAYRRSSDLFFDPASYPPAPGKPVEAEAMASNLQAVPAYIAWDTGDSLTYLPSQSALLGKLLASWGDEVTLRPVAGTLDPSTGKPAPHSWAVLDEEELMNALAPLVARRVPDPWAARLGEDRAVAFAHVVQRAPDAFTRLDGSSDGTEKEALLRVMNVVNARQVSVDAGIAGLSGRWPLRLQASSADEHGFVLRLTGCDSPPSFFMNVADGTLLASAQSEPTTGSLLIDVPAGGSVDLRAFSVPWTGKLWIEPNPARPGDGLALHVGAPAGGKLAWLILGTHAALVTVPGPLPLMVPPMPPALLLALPLDASGQISVDVSLPAEPALSGLSLMLQAVFPKQGLQHADASNAFRFDIQ